MNLSSFALRRGALIALMLVFATSLAACSGSSDESEPADGGNGGATATVENGEVDISADDLAFDVSTIEATAGEGFAINFTNNESQPHNVAVYTEEGGEAIVQGEVITGPDATTQIVVEGLDAGTYYFQCDVHPEMNGTIVVSG